MPRLMLTVSSASSQETYEIQLTSRVHRHSQVFDDTVLSEDFADMVLFDVPGQGFDDNLSIVNTGYTDKAASRATTPKDG